MAKTELNYSRRISNRNVSLIILSFIIFAWFSLNSQAYATGELFFFNEKTICKNAEEILISNNKTKEQIMWLSKDKIESSKFLTNVPTEERQTILDCFKNNLPELKSDLITKKIGYFEGKNDYAANGKIRIIEIENLDYLRIENFEIGYKKNGSDLIIPDLHVYLVEKNNSNYQYLEKLKENVGSKNYPLRGIDIDDYQHVIIYDQILNEVVAASVLNDVFFLRDFFLDIYHGLEAEIAEPKLDSDIIYEKTGILEGVGGFQAKGIVDAYFEEDIAELRLDDFKISQGFDFHLYATKKYVKNTGDWTIGPNENIYISNANTNEILRYNGTDGTFVDVFVDAGKNGGLNGPKDLVFSLDGKYLYVSSFITNEIFRYDGESGKFLDKIVTNSDNVHLKNPKMAFSPDGLYVYVISVNTNSVLKIDANTGELMRAFNYIYPNHTSFSLTGIILDSKGYVYVSNANTNEILRYNGTDGTFVDVFVDAGKNGGLNGPKDLVFSLDGKYLYVSSFITNEIFRYDGESGKFLDKIVSSHDGQISKPKYAVFDNTNNLYVSSPDLGHVLRFNGSSGVFTDLFIKKGEGGLVEPRGLEFGPQGNLYVSDAANNWILRYNEDGVFEDVFVDNFAGVLSGPDDLIFDPACYLPQTEIGTEQEDILNINNGVHNANNCYLYVSSSENNVILQYFYSNGTLNKVFVGDEELLEPREIVFGPDDNLYVSSFGTDEILRYDGNTGDFIDVFASSGGLDGPTGILIDEKTGGVYVSSSNNNQVIKYDLTTGAFSGEVFLAENYSIMRNPQSLLKGHADENLYLVSSDTDEVLRYNMTNGKLLGKFITDRSGALYQPKDMMVNKSGNLCVNSLVTNDIQCYDGNTGKYLGKIIVSFNHGLRGLPFSEFGPDGELYASNPLLNTISRHDRNTGFFSSVFAGGEISPLQSPRFLTLGSDGNIYVSSNNNHQIVRFNGTSGKFIDVFVGQSSGGLGEPQGLEFNNGFLYVSSNENHRILRYNVADGSFVDEFIKSRDGGLVSPRGIVFDNKGILYVSSNENNKILSYNSTTGKFIKEIANGKPLLKPEGLSLDDNGNLYVSSSGNNSILVYDVNSIKTKPHTIISDDLLAEPRGIFFDKTNKILYISSMTNRVLAYDTVTKSITDVSEITDEGVLHMPQGLFSNGNHIYVANRDSNDILKYDIELKDAKQFTWGSNGVIHPLGLTFNPVGDMFVVSGKTHEIFRYDGNTGDMLEVFSSFPYVDGNDEHYGNLPERQIYDLVFTSDGKYLLVSSSFTDQILRFDGKTGKFIDVFLEDKEKIKTPRHIEISPGGKYLYVNSAGQNKILVYDIQTQTLANTINNVDGNYNENTIHPLLEMHNMKFGQDGDLYVTSGKYRNVFHYDLPSGNFVKQFESGGIYLGNLQTNPLESKYLLNGINTTSHNQLIVYDHLLEVPFANIQLHDKVWFNSLPIPVLWDLMRGNIGFIEKPTIESQPIEKKAGFFRSVDGISSIGQVKLSHTPDTANIILETFEIRYDKNNYVSFLPPSGITHGPRIVACLTTNDDVTCADTQNSVMLGRITANVGDESFVIKNIDINKFPNLLLYDQVNDKRFVEIELRDAGILRITPQLFIDWLKYEFPAFPLLLFGLIAFPFTFDYFRTVFKILFLSSFEKFGKTKKHLISRMTGSKITILIPAHNEEAGIKASIEAAVRIKYKNKEIIVIDDGSTDKTYEIAKEFSDNGLIKLLHRQQASGSKAAALNYGFAYATGNLILCMDGDTLLDEDSVKNAIPLFDDKRVQAVSGNVKILSGDEGINNILTKAQAYEYLIAIELGRSFTSILNILLVISGAFGIFRREVFSGTGKFDKDTITEDFDLTLKVRKTGGLIPFARNSIAKTYCPNNLKAWIKQRRRWAHGQLQTLKKHKNILLSSNFPKRDRIAIFDMWLLDIVLNLLFVVYLIVLVPISIVMIAMGTIHILVYTLALVFIIYLISELSIFVFAVVLSRRYEYLKLTYLVPFMALFYRPFLKIVIFRSYINAARNKDATW